MIRDPTVLERLIVTLTGKRLYNCCDCDLYFRMPDRRRKERDPGVPATARDIALRSQEDSRQISPEDADLKKMVSLDAARDDQKTILIVDDHPDVLNSLTAFLGARNYNVLIADSGEEALRQSRDYRHEIHLLLSEVRLPAMSGVDLAREISLRRPQIKVLLMSLGVPSGTLFKQGWNFLPKPFTASHLPRLIVDLISTRAHVGARQYPGKDMGMFRFRSMTGNLRDLARKLRGDLFTSPEVARTPSAWSAGMPIKPADSSRELETPGNPAFPPTRYAEIQSRSA
jgi:CheY-like chemotaxis protein